MKQTISIITFLILYSCTNNSGIDNEKGKFGYSDFNSLNADSVYYYLNTSGDTIHFLEFEYEHHSEKIKIEKDTIQHIYYVLQEGNEYWANEWITYKINGEIIENESEYIFQVETCADSIEFRLINGKQSRMEFILFQYKDSIITPPIDTISSVSKKIILSESDIEDIKIKADISDTIRSDTGYIVRSRQIFINRNVKNDYQKRLKCFN